MADSPKQGSPKDPRLKKFGRALGGLQTMYPPERLRQPASRIDAKQFAQFDSASEEDIDQLRRFVVDEIDKRGRLDDFLVHLFGNRPHPDFEPAEEENEGPTPQLIPLNAAAGHSVYATQTVDGVVGPESDRVTVIRLAIEERGEISRFGIAEPFDSVASAEFDECRRQSVEVVAGPVSEAVEVVGRARVAPWAAAPRPPTRRSSTPWSSSVEMIRSGSRSSVPSEGDSEGDVGFVIELSHFGELGVKLTREGRS